MTPQEAIAIQTFRKPPLRRFFFALLKRGWVLIPAVLLFLVLTGCSVDNSAEWPEADNLVAIQQEEAARASREFAGQAVCGPGALAQWVDDKTLTCTPRRGQTYTVAGGMK